MSGGIGSPRCADYWAAGQLRPLRHHVITDMTWLKNLLYDTWLQYRLMLRYNRGVVVDPGARGAVIGTFVSPSKYYKRH